MAKRTRPTGKWEPRAVNPAAVSLRGPQRLIAETARILDPERRLSAKDFEELKEFVRLAAVGYNRLAAETANSPARGDIEDKMSKLMDACARMRIALNNLDDADLHWLFAMDSSRRTYQTWRIDDVPPAEPKRRNAIDVLVGRLHGRPVDDVISSIRCEVIDALDLMAEGAIGDLAASRRLGSDEGRKTGSIVALSHDTPGRFLIRYCLEIYRHYCAELPPATGTWNSQPAVRLIKNTYFVATGIDLSRKKDGGSDGLAQVYQQVLPVARAAEPWLPEVLRRLRQDRVLRMVYNIAVDSEADVSVAKIALGQLIDSGQLTKKELAQWMSENTRMEELRLKSPGTFESLFRRLHF